MAGPPNATSFDQILVQKQSINIVLSGVAFTKDITVESPYYSIHYSEGGDTSAVTSGQNSKTIKIYKKHRHAIFQILGGQ